MRRVCFMATGMVWMTSHVRSQSPDSRSAMLGRMSSIVRRAFVRGQLTCLVNGPSVRQIRSKSTGPVSAEPSATQSLAFDTKGFSSHKLEDELGDTYEAVQARRVFVSEALTRLGATDDQAKAVFNIPGSQNDFNVRKFYDEVHGTACENVIGFIPIPVGVVGPLVVNGENFMVPLATTEGALLASTNRGARAIRESGGAFCSVVSDGMTRSSVLAFPSVEEAAKFKIWAEDVKQLEEFKKEFRKTTKFGSLLSAECTIAGRYAYIRFCAKTGDAMGMNMVGKGSNQIIEYIMQQYALERGTRDALRLVSLSSNMCTDKKPSAINWIKGRGKSCIAEVVLPRQVVEDVLKTSIERLVTLNTTKNLVGSSLAGSIGGNNAHAANLVSAAFLAHGQDVAQNVGSSNCLLQMEAAKDGEELRVSVTMPSLEVGTVGGGTSLKTQSACLQMHNVVGSNEMHPGRNATKLATVVCATVLAGEISLNSALASNHLMSAHLNLNRRKN